MEAEAHHPSSMWPYKPGPPGTKTIQTVDCGYNDIMAYTLIKPPLYYMGYVYFYSDTTPDQLKRRKTKYFDELHEIWRISDRWKEQYLGIPESKTANQFISIIFALDNTKSKYPRPEIFDFISNDKLDN